MFSETQLTIWTRLMEHTFYDLGELLNESNNNGMETEEMVGTLMYVDYAFLVHL